MFLHLGQDIVIRMKDVIGIFDLETSTISNTTRDYLAAAQKAGQVVSISDEMPKSFILCQDSKGKIIVYTSQISTATLLKRTGFTDEISNL
ncbi:MAG: DUF370 domain-containing protein [Thermocaproicibacter melissae]|jgi:extracellular matrix regulatory protein B|uniref:extracellular matrix regulator RemB n=1 Tax=Thermocaproicibacter melissae TaxID=2966552 RepID=UPI0024B1EC6C|nr:extracellular matrix/biofilm biosynthesis regulator RemA family protein [Thermocaproicibacter melissae]WBY64449.1 DUF370 domain-containing protein [Thermocaproicibacter melissae]